MADIRQKASNSVLCRWQNKLGILKTCMHCINMKDIVINNFRFHPNIRKTIMLVYFKRRSFHSTGHPTNMSCSLLASSCTILITESYNTCTVGQSILMFWELHVIVCSRNARSKMFSGQTVGRRSPISYLPLTKCWTEKSYNTLRNRKNKKGGLWIFSVASQCFSGTDFAKDSNGMSCTDLFGIHYIFTCYPFSA